MDAAAENGPGVSSRLRSVVERVERSVIATTEGLFGHGPRPLTETHLYPGDTGLLGPDSVSWEVIGDVAAFVGGLRALLVQAAHPEVVAGVDQHSTYQVDPLGRLSRTAFYVTQTTYGAQPEVEEAVAAVRRAHLSVRGHSDRGRPYRAADPALAAWVHNALTESFLVAYQTYGARSLGPAEADRFVAEQARIGALLGADPLPRRADELHDWIRTHPDLAPSQGQADAVAFLRRPPLPAPVRLGYQALFQAAVVTLPRELSTVVALESRPGAGAVGRGVTSALRRALGSSPAWHAALVRTGAPVPAGRFRSDRLR